MMNYCLLTFLVGEWWKADTDDVINQWMQTGMPPNVSDAHTINGFPGPVPNCTTSKGTHNIRIYAIKVLATKIEY